MPGWRTSTQGITQLEKLPQAAREYLTFLEKESGARIGMVSTGPGREQTMFVDEFIAELKRIDWTENWGFSNNLTNGANDGCPGCDVDGESWPRS